jgi:lauroyl/myristoyl acyltransferase
LEQVALQGEPIIGARKGIAKRVYDAKYRAIEGNMPVRFINAAENPLAIREVFRSLARNECVLFASTGRGGKAWHAERFLGRQATFNETPFRVAVKSGATLLPVFVIDADPLARVVIEGPLSAAGDADPAALIKEYVAVLERYVRLHPDHFAQYLLDMRLQAWWDDHPFFSDYPAQSGPAETRDRGA